MDILQSIILGILQGITEFLPVSSSGHLLVLREFMGLGDIPKLFDILLHVATLVAVVAVFYKRIVLIVVSLFKTLMKEKLNEEERISRAFVIPVLISTFVTFALALFVTTFEFVDSPVVTGSLFIFTGIVLFFTKFVPEQPGRELPDPLRSIVIGIAQWIAVLPGVSRSGSTISAAVFLGIDRKTAGEFSFLLAIPAILAAAVLKIVEAGDLTAVASPLVIVSGMIAALISGLIALRFLLRLIERGKFHYFAYYLIPLGVFVLIRFV
jgi:undecaprenyl-diphosphatase